MPPTHSNPNGSPPNHLIDAYLQSLTLTNPNLALDATNKTLSVRPTPNQPRTVAIISGSALHHSPYIASFVGPGLLTACIGTSAPKPYDPVEHVRIAIQERAVTTQRVLFIVPQYGMDEFIIQSAALSAKRHDPTLQFEHLIAPHTLPGPELGRPGAGLPLLLKICSATADRGYSLEQVFRVGKLVAKNLLSVDSVWRPGQQDGAGCSPSEPDMSQRVRHMISKMLDPKLRMPGLIEVNSNEVVLHISGQSGLTVLEMGAITSEAVKQLEYWHVRPVRIYTESVSEFSVHGRQGVRDRDFTITILNVCNTDIGGPSMIQLLDAPAEAAGWTAFVKGTSWEAKNTRLLERNVQWARPSGLKCNPQVIWRAATNGSKAVVAFAKHNKLARGYPYQSWEGDAAAPMQQNNNAQDIWNCAKGAVEGLALLQALSDDMVIVINDMLSAIAPALNNPFGALVTIFFIALTQSLRTQSETAEEVNLGLWIYALEDAFQELSQYASHRPAMASMLEVFDTFLQTLHSTGDLSNAAKAAEQSPKTANDLGARLLCAFFAGLTGNLNRNLEQGSDVEKKHEVGEQERGQEQPAKEANVEADRSSSDTGAGEDPGALVLHHSLQKEESTLQTSEKLGQPAISADEKHLVASEEASASLGPPESPTKEPGSGTEVPASLGAALGLTSREATPKEEPVQTVPTEEDQVTEASRDAIVDALQIKHSDFDAAMEGIRSRERVPLPTRQMEETTLLDMVRQQIETLGVSSKEQAATERDADEEEYEFV